MQLYAPEKIHNVGLFGHVGCGKTTLTEALLLRAGAISRLGRVEDGNTISDYDPDEQKRGMSINLSVVPLEWSENKITLIDAPGYADFVGDMASAMRVIDGAVIVMDASAGVEVGTEKVWELAVSQKVPRILFINKLDRDNANFFRCVEQAREILDESVTPMQIPIGVARDFRGVISLRQQTAWLCSGKQDGKSQESAVPADLVDQMHEWRTQLIDKIAATNDDLIEKYLESGEDALTPEELVRGLRSGIANGSIVPVFCGSGLQVSGMGHLLDGIIDSIPSAARKLTPATNLLNHEAISLRAAASEPLTALVFKTLIDPYGKMSYFRVYSGEFHGNTTAQNPRLRKDERIGHVYQVRGKEQETVALIGPGDIGMTTKLTETTTGDTLCTPDRPIELPAIEFPTPLFTVVVKPHGRSDLDKLGLSLARMLEEDPTLRTSRDVATGEALLSGLGESHLQIIADRMKRKFDTHVDIDLPRVHYRETIRRTADAQYRHKKQTGGAGQFADVTLRVEPLEPDPSREDPLEFVNEIVGGVISRGFMPAIEKGVREAMAEGILAGHPVVDVRVAVFDGKEHPVDSKEIAFMTAGKQAFKLAAQKANPVIMEPISVLEITVPEEFAGDVMGDLNTRRGRVLGMMPAGRGKTTITAQVPLAECLRYATELRAITQARGTFTMSHDHYEDVPAHLVDALIETFKRERGHE
ncbi:MAG: elongation factor G [Chloroflexaceae bacterium]|nr:elongation factor G [Chloroflexaceae bacterium]